MFRSLCDHHQAFLRIKSINAGYMLGSQLVCLQLVPVYYSDTSANEDNSFRNHIR